MLGGNPDIHEAIAYNDDNLTYGAVISVYSDPKETVAARTDDSIHEPTQMLADARLSPENWNSFLSAVVSNPDIIARVNEKGPQ